MKTGWCAAITLGLLTGAAPTDAGASERSGAAARGAVPPRVEAAAVTGATAIRLDGDFGEAVTSLWPLIAKSRTGFFKELARPRATPFASQFDAFPSAGSPDFNDRSFRSTNVLRWAFKPGSAVYVAWQQGREEVTGFGRLRFRRDLRGPFGVPANNAFLVKFSY